MRGYLACVMLCAVLTLSLYLSTLLIAPQPFCSFKCGPSHLVLSLLLCMQLVLKEMLVLCTWGQTLLSHLPSPVTKPPLEAPNQDSFS